MIKKKYLFIFFILIVTNIVTNLKVTNTERKISIIEKKINKLQFEIDLNEVNWAYINRPENLYKLNEESYEFKPIL
ncbi:hypothetical protein OA848_05085, partial [Rickettsiales bacterium]|nr:hypothetical protein [Rickettsiales bacterium]